MDFHPLRNIRNIPGLSVFEGIFTIKNLSFPHVILAITSFLFQRPHASPVFVLTSLPTLIYLAESQTPWQFFTTSATSLIPALDAGGLLTSWNLTAKASEVLVGQTLLSGFVGIMTILAVLLHRMVIRFGLLEEGSWDTILVFGLVWAAALLTLTSCSPLGRFGIPSPFPADIPALRPILRYLGTMGTDVILGSAAYAMYLTGERLWGKRSEIDHSDLPTYHNVTPHHSSSASGSGTRLLNESQSSRSTDSTLDTTPTSYSTFTSAPSASDNSTAPTSRSPSSRRRTPIKKSIFSMAGGLGVLYAAETFKTPLGTVSDSIDIQTPFGLGFVLPQFGGPWRISSLIHEAQTIGNRANLLLFPESAYHAVDKWDRRLAIDEIVRLVCQQYGVWVQLGIDTPMEEYPPVSGIEERRNLSVITRSRGLKKINEVILIGPEGEVGSYAKQALLPLVESFPFHKGIMPIPTWTINLPAPPGVNKTDWASSAPYVRPISISPLICLDTFHPDLLSSLSESPDLFTVSASALTTEIGEQIIGQAESIALTHSAPVMVLAGSRGRMDQGTSAILDAWGRTLAQQRGGKSFILQISLPYKAGGGKAKGKAWSSMWTLGSGILLVGSASVGRRIKRAARTDDFRMKVFKYWKGPTAGQADPPPDPMTPPPKYVIGRVRRSSAMRNGKQAYCEEESGGSEISV